MNREKNLNVISFLFALLFSYAAISKLLDVQKFQVELGQSPLLNFIAIPLSYLVPAVELALSVMVFILPLRQTALYFSFSLMIMFTTYIIIIMNYSYHIPCSCGGILGKLGWKIHLLFNSAFVLVGLYGIVLSAQIKSGFKNIAPSATKL